MIVVVADTSPLRYLVLIQCDYLLPRLYSKIWIPGAVLAELRQAKPALVRHWAAELPEWIEVRQVVDTGLPQLAELDLGEREALVLAAEVHANLVLIDERPGTLTARQLGFKATGTLGVLVEAAQVGLVSIDEALDRLERTNFRRTPDLFAHVRLLVRARPRA
jgi:predicted nucleic acid-binding protein